jgi:alkylhydroperoxidase/carboxymuconolactone decarboxylase family protein YurZ
MFPRKEKERMAKKKVLQVTGKWDGNGCAIRGHTRWALRDAGVSKDKISQVIDECTTGDYSHAVVTCVSALEEAGYKVR